MMNCKRLISAVMVLIVSVWAMAQSSINSPYTRYGFGQLDDQSFGNSKAMGGIAYGLRNGFQINTANPASYTAVDSLTFLFDAGMSLQNANFKDGDIKTNAKNSSFDYIAMQFRLWKRMGMTVGFLPFSSVGYNVGQVYDFENKDDGSWSESFKGDGGFHQVVVGLGYKVWDNLSVGANVSYLYGDISHTSTTAIGMASTQSIKTTQFSVSDYKLDFGLQYTYNINKKNAVHLGAVYSLGHELNGEAYKYHQKVGYNNSYPVVQSETGDTIANPFKLPHTFGLGLTYVYDNRLTVGIDYTLQKWETAVLGWNQFEKGNVEMGNRSKIAVGAEFIPTRYGRNYLGRIRYRAGAYYSTPYTKISGEDGACEYGVSAGFGFPLFQSKSILNISGQWVKISPKIKGMLEENYLRVNIGLTFNELWFKKWRVN